MDDHEDVKKLVEPYRKLPLDVRIIVDEDHTGRLQRTISNILEESDAIVPYLTSKSVDNQWVNQEIGYAAACDTAIIPVFEGTEQLQGFLRDMEGVQIDPDKPLRTTSNLLGKLRSEFSPGAIYEPNWFFTHLCRYDRCGEVNKFKIEREQPSLWNIHKRGAVLRKICNSCCARHFFDPVTFEHIDADSPLD